MDEIKVSVFKRKGRRFYEMQYRDEMDNKIRKSTGQLKKRDADRLAGKWEAELRDGLDTKRSGRMPWAKFRQLYEDEVLASLADNTDENVGCVFNVLERFIKPSRLSDVNEDAIGRYQTHLRKKGRAESTIKGHLAHLIVALSWAKKRKLISEVPEAILPKRAKRASDAMKGRPCTAEEAEWMLEKTEAAVISTGLHLSLERAEEVVASWKYYQRGMWLSGLRLEESMDLCWDDRSRLCVDDLDCDRPMILIPGGLEKGNKDRVLPMAPEFAEFLRLTAASKRHGFVFNPLARRQRYGERFSAAHVGKVVCRIGKAANVKVSEKAGKVKYASCHDFRRSFAERWASQVMPNVLQELMRHENIQTTMRYYVDQNAKRTSAILWEAHRAHSAGATLGATTLADEVQESGKPS